MSPHLAILVSLGSLSIEVCTKECEDTEGPFQIFVVKAEDDEASVFRYPTMDETEAQNLVFGFQAAHDGADSPFVELFNTTFPEFVWEAD